MKEGCHPHFHDSHTMPKAKSVFISSLSLFLSTISFFHTQKHSICHASNSMPTLKACSQSKLNIPITNYASYMNKKRHKDQPKIFFTSFYFIFSYLVDRVKYLEEDAIIIYLVLETSYLLSKISTIFFLYIKWKHFFNKSIFSL